MPFAEWAAGHRPPGIGFGPGDAVEAIAGPQHARRGVIVLLVGIVPEPRYLVAFDPGDRHDVVRRLLRFVR